jgi:hypothetical protein
MPVPIYPYLTRCSWYARNFELEAQDQHQPKPKPPLKKIPDKAPASGTRCISFLVCPTQIAFVPSTQSSQRNKRSREGQENPSFQASYRHDCGFIKPRVERAYCPTKLLPWQYIQLRGLDWELSKADPSHRTGNAASGTIDWDCGSPPCASAGS